MVLAARIDLGVRRGVAQALADAKRDGHSISISRDGKIVRIPPEQIEIPDADLLSEDVPG